MSFSKSTFNKVLRSCKVNELGLETSMIDLFDIPQKISRLNQLNLYHEDKREITLI